MRDVMLKTLTDFSFATFAAATMVADSIPVAAGDGIYEWINRFGALALCAFMVLQNYRQSDSLSKIINRKDVEAALARDQLLAITRDLLAALQANTHGLGTMVESLNQRPCIIERPLKEM